MDSSLPSANQRVAIVTGSSSGIGYATSLLLAKKGFYTYASVRDINKSVSLQSIADAERLPLKRSCQKKEEAMC
jgi:NAD(P)-dependent dehydrogenase (short-subunit alcohol dehydrogenase family)